MMASKPMKNTAQIPLLEGEEKIYNRVYDYFIGQPLPNGKV